jgi:hypothetical protein
MIALEAARVSSIRKKISAVRRTKKKFAPARVAMSDRTCYSLAGTDSLLVLLVQKLY